MDSENFSETIKKLRTVGHSSGWDAFTGFVLTVKVLTTAPF